MNSHAVFYFKYNEEIESETTQFHSHSIGVKKNRFHCEKIW